MPNFLTKIFGGQVVDKVGSVIDTLSTSDDEKSEAKARISSIVLDSLNKLYENQKEVLVTEMSGGWLQRNWRPLIMLTFAVIIICKWFGYTDGNISDQLELKLMDILELGLGGYIIGRSAEKITDRVTRNVDLPFLKKKDRKDSLE